MNVLEYIIRRHSEPANSIQVVYTQLSGLSFGVPLPVPGVAVLWTPLGSYRRVSGMRTMILRGEYESIAAVALPDDALDLTLIYNRYRGAIRRIHAAGDAFLARVHASRINSICDCMDPSDPKLTELASTICECTGGIRLSPIMCMKLRLCSSMLLQIMNVGRLPMSRPLVKYIHFIRRYRTSRTFLECVSDSDCKFRLVSLYNLTDTMWHRCIVIYIPVVISAVRKTAPAVLLPISINAMNIDISFRSNATQVMNVMNPHQYNTTCIRCGRRSASARENGSILHVTCRECAIALGIPSPPPGSLDPYYISDAKGSIEVDMLYIADTVGGGAGGDGSGAPATGLGEYMQSCIVTEYAHRYDSIERRLVALLEENIAFLDILEILVDIEMQHIV